MHRQAMGLLLSVTLTVAASSRSARAGAPAPERVLRQLSEQYYDVVDAGLARASCYVESREILREFDDRARKILSKPDYEAVIVPGKPVIVKARDIPQQYWKEARAGVAAYSLAATLVLNAMFGALNAVPELLDPDELAGKYDIQLGGKPGARRIELVAKAMVTEDGKRVLPWQRKGEHSGLRPKEHIVIALDKKDRLHTITKTTVAGSEETVVELEETRDGRWLVAGLDISKRDDRERLVERRQFTISYTEQKGVLLPSKVRSKAVDKEGKTIRRRDEPNPVSIRFSRYRVELRE